MVDTLNNYRFTVQVLFPNTPDVIKKAVNVKMIRKIITQRLQLQSSTHNRVKLPIPIFLSQFLGIFLEYLIRWKRFIHILKNTRTIHRKKVDIHIIIRRFQWISDQFRMYNYIRPVVFGFYAGELYLCGTFLF